MAVIYLRHPVHGAKVASTTDEAEHDVKRGWRPFDPEDLMSDEALDAIDERTATTPAGNIATGEGTRRIDSTTSPAGLELARRGMPDAAIAKADIEHNLAKRDGPASPTEAPNLSGRRRRAAPIADETQVETVGEGAGEGDDELDLSHLDAPKTDATSGSQAQQSAPPTVKVPESVVKAQTAQKGGNTSAGDDTSKA